MNVSKTKNDITQILIDYFLKKDATIPEKEIEIIQQNCKSVVYQKKEFIGKSNDLEVKLVYVIKGVLRTFITADDGVEYNRYFAFDDWWAGEFARFIANQPAAASIQALEKTEVIEFSHKNLEVLRDHCPVFINLFIKMCMVGIAKILEKEEAKKFKTIDDLYQDLFTSNPLIIRKIPLYHIASYLGVKPESLSRVKKKINVKS